MIKHIASAYDQNPARLALIVRSNRRMAEPKRTKNTAVMRLLFGLAAIAGYIWFTVPL